MVGHVGTAKVPICPAHFTAECTSRVVMIEAHQFPPREFLGNHAHIVRPIRPVPTRVVVEIPRHDKVAAATKVGTFLQGSKKWPSSSIQTFRTVIVIPRGKQAK